MMSGGAGYVMSSSGLDALVRVGFPSGACREDGGDEDVEVAKCLKVGDLSCLCYFVVNKIFKDTFENTILFYFLEMTFIKLSLPMIF